MLAKIKRLLTEESGQGLAEYGLILALVSLAVVVALGLVGTNLNTLFGKVNTELAK